MEDTFSLIRKIEIGKGISAILSPEKYDFSGKPFFVYPKFETVDDFLKISEEEKYKISVNLLNILKNIIHIPGFFVGALGYEDLVFANNELRILLPPIDFEKVSELKALSERRKIFVAPEILESFPPSDNSSLWVIGNIVYNLSPSAELRKLSERLFIYEPAERKFDFDIPYYSVPSTKKVVAIKKIKRREEDQIFKVITTKNEEPIPMFLGVIGPQRIGKTTLMESIHSRFREVDYFFLNVSSASELILQLLQVGYEKMPEELRTQLEYCVSNVCKIDTLSIILAQVFKYVKNVVIFVDDYQECQENLKAILINLSKLNIGNDLKILAFSTEIFDEFREIIYLRPFDEEDIERVIIESFDNFKNPEIFARWLYSVSDGFPGLVSEIIKYCFEKGIVVEENGAHSFNPDLAEEFSFSAILKEKTQIFEKSPEVYLAILGQKFFWEEIQILEEILGEKFQIEKLRENGIVYLEYNKVRFSLKHYWEVFYSQIPEEKKKELHLKIIEAIDDPFKKAWHYEQIGDINRSIITYLKLLKEMFKNHYSPSFIQNVIQNVKKLLKGRVLYSLLSYEIELMARTDSISDIEIPKNKLFEVLDIKYHYLKYDYDYVLKNYDKNITGFGNLGTIRRRFYHLACEYSLEPRADYISRLNEMLEVLHEDNELQVVDIVNMYIFISSIVTDIEKSTQYLKKAEQLCLRYDLKHRLPTIYNNLSVNSRNVYISLEYLKKSISVANSIGLPNKGLMAELNMCYHMFYSGNVKEMLIKLFNIRDKLFILNSKHEISYSYLLESFYHSYNFEIEEALGDLKKAKEFSENPESVEWVFQEAMVYLLARDIDISKRILSNLNLDELGYESRLVAEVVLSYGTEQFSKAYENYRKSNVLIFREELLAIFGSEIVKINPDSFKEDLDMFESKFSLEGLKLSQALIFEGFAHYYEFLKKEYKVDTNRQKAIETYKECDLFGAVRKISEIYNISTKDFQKKDKVELVIEDILKGLVTVEQSTTPDNVCTYFVSKIISIFPIRNAGIKVEDKFLDKTYEFCIGNCKHAEEDVVVPSPFKLYVSDTIDKYSKYSVILSDNEINLGTEDFEKFVSVFEIVENSLTVALKTVLSRLRTLIDPLTKLYTRYQFFEEANKIFLESKTLNSPVSVVMIDIDNFKKVNDRYGHQVGDKVLQFVAKTLREHLRITDVIARFGGEEFIVALRGTSYEEAVNICERLRSLVKELNPFDFKITISFGVSNYPKFSAESIEDLIILADIALYQAKNTGKDKVVLYEEGMTGGIHA